MGEQGLYERVASARDAVDKRLPKGFSSKIGIILGTGLGGLSQEIDVAVEIPYNEIPGFPQTTLDAHAGRLVAGTLEGRPVLAMDGRFHFYEGYDLDAITLPVRVLGLLGAEILIVSNACGGLNPLHGPGEIMLIEDHINLMGMAGINPLIGPNDERLGVRYPDMCAPYDEELLALTEAVALDLRIPTHRGTYVAVSGPNLETRAEYRFLRAMGADVVGMSTASEVTVAVHQGLRVLGLSCITDKCLADALKPANIEEIIATAGTIEPKLTALVKGVLTKLAG